MREIKQEEQVTKNTGKGRRLGFDIETDGLLDTMTVVHSLVLIDMDTGEGWSCCDQRGYVSKRGFPVVTVMHGLKMLIEADMVCGHNIIGFDIPAIKKVYPWFDLDRRKVYDSLIVSRLIWPEIRDNDFALRKQKTNRVRVEAERLIKERLSWNQTSHEQYEEAKAQHKEALKLYRRALKAREEDSDPYEDECPPEKPTPPDKPEFQETDEGLVFKEVMNTYFPARLIGSHGLEAWGYRLGEWKGDYSQEMKAKGLDPWAAWNPDMQDYCEQDVVVTVKLWELQESKGYSEFALEIERDFAWIIAEMERNGFPFDLKKAEKLQSELVREQALLMDELQEAFPPITEEWTFVPKVNNSVHGYVKGKPIKRSKTIVFNPTSRDHIAKWLKKKYGWEPEEYTGGGKPKVDESILKKLPYPEAKSLARFFMLDKRLGMLEGKGGKGLMSFARRDNGSIHGGVITNGAVTRRCTHRTPNMAQIPATTVPYGHEFRSLLYAPEGWTLLGWDASGLELRCFAHYMDRYDGGAYTSTVLDGDIHWVHAQALSGGLLDGQEYDEHNDVHAYWRNKVAKRFISMG